MANLSSNGYALKAQVLLYRLQLQQATVARATEHLNNAHAKLEETQDHRKAVSSRLKINQDFMDNAETAQVSPADRKQVQSEISRLKEELAKELESPR